MKRLQRLLILLLTVVFVLPLFPISAAASGWSMFPWSMVFGDSAEQAYQEEYDSEPDYGYVDPYAYGDTVNEYADPDDFGQPVDAGDTVSSYYGDAYGGTFDGDSSSSDDTAIENEATAPGANDAGPNKEDKDAEEKDGDIQAEQDGLTEQTITAAQPKPTNDILSFKEMLANRLDRLSSAAPARDQLPDVTITIRGHLPYGATAKARYFSAAEDERFDGSALFAYEITIYDAFGAVYRPASELTVTVTSPLIDTALQDGMEVTVLRCTGNDGETEEVGSESSDDLCRFRTRELPARFVFATDRPCRTVFSEYLPEPDRSAGEGGSQVTVSGALPAGVTAEVRPVSHNAYDVELGRPLLTFDVTLYRGGAEYQPDADRPATVTVRSSRIASALDDGYAIAVWHIDEDGGCQRVSDVSARGDTVSFTACEFSPYVLGLTAREIDVFADAYVEASLLGIDDCVAPQWDGSVEPELGDGLELVDACEVDCAGKGLWLDVTLTDEPDLGELESLTLYGLADGELVESVSAEITGAGEIAAIALDEADGFALVKDTGLRSRSLTVNPEEDESVTISGRIPTNATATAITAMDEAAEDAVCAYDISLLNGGKEYQPGEANPVTVAIRNPAIAAAVAAGSELSLWHVSDEGQREEIASFSIEGDEITFTATSFSIYSIEEAKDPPEAPPQVQDLDELALNFNDSGFILSYRDNNNVYHYFTNSLNNKGAFIEKTNISAASIWYFEKVEDEENQYCVYTYVNGVKQYMKNTSGNLMELSPEAGTAFELSEVPEGAPDGRFYFKVAGQNKWLQHSGSGSGIRLYTDNNNASNSSIVITYALEDYYELDGKSFGIAFHEESVKATGLTADSQTGGSTAKLKAEELLVKPDVLDYSQELLIAQDGDLPEWTFEWVSENNYYLTTKVGGQTRYLTLDSENLRLTDGPDQNGGSLIKVESGTGEHKGKYRFSVGAYALTLSGGKTSNGFVSSKNGGDYSWLNLVSLTDELTEDDFVIYSAKKVDISDRSLVPDGSQVVVFTRLWNEEKKKYEFYAINHDGKLIRCYESGDMIQWVGSQFNTALWDFTEYTYPDGTPNYYYELQSDYSGQYIAPQAGSGSDEGQVFSDSTIGINLNGRRFGYYYSTILAWDNENYAYAGLKTEDGQIVSCPLEEAEVFYFAIMKETEPEVQLTDVETVDNKQHGITMRMVNFPDRATMKSFLGSDAGGVGTTLQTGLLSTDLGADGYPTTCFPSVAGNSLGDMYAGANEVNHLFIKNIYDSSGYFEYDSTQNFATLLKKDDNGNYYLDDEFTVYNELGTARTTISRESLQHSQFLPYNDLSDQYSENNPYNLYDATMQELPDSDPRKGEPLLLVEGETDYHFALEIEATFTQTADGNDAWGHDIIYEFTGDDDFWLYVDGELVIDLGGIHSAVPGSVNYRTGEVFVNGTHTTLKDIFYNNYISRGDTPEQAQSKIDEKFKLNDDGQWVFKDYTTHTMKIFYMERGAGASNLHMRFNLASVKPGTVLLSKELDGVDESESNLAEFPYQIFYLRETDGTRVWEQITRELVAENPDVKVVYQDTNRAVDYYPSLTLGSATYEGVYMLKPGETAEISFPEDAVYYYIRECGVDTDVYAQVTVNGESLTGTAAGTASLRQDYSFGYVDPSLDPEAPASGYLKINENPRAAFVNHVQEDVGQTLTFTKLLFDEKGTEPIHTCDETFSFRLYLGTENDDLNDLPPAFLYKYHVKDSDGNYCSWDASEQSFKKLPGDKTDYDLLTDAEKAAATFYTSPNGSIANIPVDYTVEVRELLPGTKYEVEERSREVPDGYSLQRYVWKAYADAAGTESEVPPAGIIVTDKDPHVDIRNLKGWGLRIYKTWSDGDFMEERDPVYFAVYIKDGGALTLVDGTVRQLGFGEDTLYWYLPSLTIDGHEYDFDQYVVREVTLGDPVVDDDGAVTDYGSITVLGEGATFRVNGKKYGDTESESLEYKVSYKQGEPEDDANVRVDEVTNSRQGVELYKTDWAGAVLEGAVFTLTDGNGNDACGNGEEPTGLTSRADGLITTAYLRPGETYTLTEIKSPAGYRALPAPLTISVSADNEVTVSGGEGWDEADWAFTDWYTQYPGQEGVSIAKIYVKDKPFTVEMKKIDAVTNEPLADVHFALYRQIKDSHGDPRKDYDPLTGYEDLITDEYGLVPQLTEDFRSGTLKPGTYYLCEEKPLLDGYLPLSGDILFTVDKDGFTLDPFCDSVVRVSETEEGGALKYTVTIPNEMFDTVALTVRKVVENGTMADPAFNFTAKLYLPDGQTVWEYSDDDFNNGAASFQLSNNGNKVLNIPKGAVVKVTEDNPGPAYATRYQLDNGASVDGLICQTEEITAPQTLTFTNTRKTVKVTVKKTVVGSSGNFHFTARLKDGGVDCAGYTLSNGIVTDENGEAGFDMSPGTSDTVTRVLTVPYGCDLTVSEDAYDNYTTTYKLGNGNTTDGNSCSIGNITVNQTLLFTNTQSSVSPTGYGGSDHIGAFQGLCLLGLALLAAVVIPAERKRRKAAADGRRQV